VTTDGVQEALYVDPATNHAGGMYDLAGNMREDSLNRYLYDAFSMMKDRSPGLGSEYYIFNRRRAAGYSYNRWQMDLDVYATRAAKFFVSTRVLTAISSATATWLTSYVYRDGLLAGAERVQEEGGRRYFQS